MKKYLALLCAAMLCVCCLALAACGGGASGSAAASGTSASAASGSASTSSAATSEASASASSSSAVVDPATTYPGKWLLAAAEYQGVTVAGDFTMMLGSETGMEMNLNADGTGTMTLGTDSHDVTWKSTGDNTFELANAESATTMPATFQDNAIKLTMQSDEYSGAVIFTKDGTYADLPTIAVDSAQAITSTDALTGSWELCGMNMMGITMYGDPAALATAVGDADYTATFNADGSGSLMGESVTWTIDDKGATANIGGVNASLKTLDGDLCVDMSEAIGGTSMILVYEKK